ncbi:hypothetical protein [Mangrovicella endophytica]|uniref:hypothetical protein n=1 Tax=Mangrovicella endophytica TaxID=2066697 RepID=UPI000C9DBC01|nr:hypothetical protein [Mangrovicella endophytica]
MRVDTASTFKDDLDFGEVLDQVARAARDEEPVINLAVRRPSGVWRIVGAAAGLFAVRREAADRAYFADREVPPIDADPVPLDEVVPPAGESEPAEPPLAAAAEIDPSRFSTNAEDVARELGLKPELKLRDLRRIRRTFAADNHPDRVPAEWREAANRRMTIANMMIDEAIGRK